MELNRESLEFLAEQAVKANGPHDPKFVLEAEAGERPQIILGQDEKLVDIEPLMSGRARFRGTLSTSSIADFAGYTKRRYAAVEREEATQVAKVPVFIDPDTMSARAFFNLGNVEYPGHADDTAILTLKASAAFAELLGLTPRPGRMAPQHTQKALAEFLEDWRADITAFSGFDADGAYVATPVIKAIAAVRQVSIEAMNKRDSVVGDMSATATSLESIEAKSQHALPIALAFRCIPYDGLTERSITVRISVVTGAKDPQFILRIVREGDLVEAIAQEFKDRLLQDLATEAALTVGVFKP